MRVRVRLVQAAALFRDRPAGEVQSVTRELCGSHCRRAYSYLLGNEALTSRTLASALRAFCALVLRPPYGAPFRSMAPFSCRQSGRMGACMHGGLP
jgi:hypothetical protein